MLCRATYFLIFAALILFSCYFLGLLAATGTLSFTGDADVPCLVGKSCVLPCTFHSDISEVIWSKIGEMVPVQFYSKNRTFHLLHTFVDRAFLFPDQIHKGNTMLLHQDVKPQDNGTYECQIYTKNGTKTYLINVEVNGFSTTVTVFLLSALVIVTGLVLCCIYKCDKSQSPETPQSPSEPDVCTSSQPSDQNNLMVKFLVFILGLGSLLPWHIYVTASLYVQHWFNTSLWIFTISLFTPLHPLLRLMAPNMFSSFHLRFPLKINIITWSLVLIPWTFFLVAAFIKAALDETTFFCITVVIIWLSMFFSPSLQHLDLQPEYHSVFTQGQAAAGTSAALIMLFSIAITNNVHSAAFCHFLCAGLGSLVIVISYFGLSIQTRGQVYLKNSRNSEEPSSVWLLGQDIEQNNVSKTIIQNENEQEIQKENEQNENVQNEMQKEKVQNIKSQTSVFLLLKNIRFKALYVIAVPAVTLSVFPAVTADVTTVFTGQWECFFAPVCCFLIFSIFNLIGSVIAAQVSWSFENFSFRVLFPVFVFIRAGFIPLLMFCNVQPRRTSLPVNPFWSHDVVFAVIMAFFSLSHGCLRSLSMSYALHTGKDNDTDMAVVLIRLLSGLGLTLGAALSFAFRSLI